jgi:transposase-like protein
MMENEMDQHPGYEKSERSANDDYHNGHKHKRINSSYGNMDIQVPQDRKSTLSPRSSKNGKRISLLLIKKSFLCTTTRQISDTLEDIYGFEASERFYFSELSLFFSIH